MLDNGYPVYLNSDDKEGDPSQGQPGAFGAHGGKGDLKLKYESGKPAIVIKNPMEQLVK